MAVGGIGPRSSDLIWVLLDSASDTAMWTESTWQYREKKLYVSFLMDYTGDLIVG